MKKKKKNKEQEQQAVIRKARQTLGITTEQLAEQLGVSLKTVRSWLEPASSASHRRMPDTARLLLKHLVAAKPKPSGTPLR
jgi:DNA-binding transcriptional regulator YiaG